MRLIERQWQVDLMFSDLEDDPLLEILCMGAGVSSHLDTRIGPVHAVIAL